jgi:uncharacterized protein
MRSKTRFEWDVRKAEANKRKHGVSFDLAREVFADELRIRLPRGDEHGEDRWWMIGLVGVQVLVVVHTWIEDEEEIIRIISARKATPSERRRYEEG